LPTGGDTASKQTQCSRRETRVGSGLPGADDRQPRTGAGRHQVVNGCSHQRNPWTTTTVYWKKLPNARQSTRFSSCAGERVGVSAIEMFPRFSPDRLNPRLPMAAVFRRFSRGGDTSSAVTSTWWLTAGATCVNDSMRDQELIDAARRYQRGDGLTGVGILGTK
jgi:hypothetical protein